ncbi:MAG: bifunctional demethylmenaquinone methyltransferase/2-methoxy-6-polyprenyl-1,4-benzoquinol methylase UbiE [Bdellovibrionaceae bacterium]|nr:bifunctional demethylmenaquinone methyltransferase/2-methoxy-6-polyprenyl-1,4-benzoquinol methylase UbiE [Pseudobdellovibrionaceae bacterium]
MYKEPEAHTIRQMFSEIAPSYDKANSILSLGIHHLWKQTVVRLSGAKRGDHILDCATGTGDLALLFKKTVGTPGHVTATDFCADILAFAPKKAKQENLDIQFETADVTQLPYADKSFDISSISFGIRNVENLDKALSELARVTRKKVMILEFGQVEAPVLGSVYNFYSNTILPKIGGWISGQPSAYSYLNSSAKSFPSGQKFIDRAINTGAYSNMTCKRLSFGIAYIYSGTPK